MRKNLRYRPRLRSPASPPKDGGLGAGEFIDSNLFFSHRRFPSHFIPSRVSKNYRMERGVNSAQFCPKSTPPPFFSHILEKSCKPCTYGLYFCFATPQSLLCIFVSGLFCTHSQFAPLTHSMYEGGPFFPIDIHYPFLENYAVDTPQ